MGLDKCIMTHIHHYNIQNSFIALKYLYALSIHSSLIPQPLETTDPFSVSIVLLFPKCHTIEIIQYVAFIHLVLCIYVFSISFHGLEANFFLALKNNPLIKCNSLLISSCTKGHSCCFQVWAVMNETYKINV